MNTNQNNVGKGYWLAWFLASVMGFGMGALLGVQSAYRSSHSDTSNAIMGLMIGIVMGAIGGYLQWVVLRERITGAGLWVLASALGFGLAIGATGVIGADENYGMAGILIGSVYGVAGGILQWLALRRKIARARWWLLANLLGSLVGVMGMPVVAAISEAGNWDLAVMTFGLLFGAGYGAITGAALVWMLRQSPSANIEGLATAH